MRNILAMSALLSLLSCGEVDNSTAQQADGRTVEREDSREPVSGEPQQTIRLDTLDFRRAEGQTLPLLICSGHVLHKTKPNLILTELTSFGEDLNAKLVPLPGFRQSETEGSRYLSTTYTYEELFEMCQMGLNRHFETLVKTGKIQLEEDSESILESYEVSKTPSLTTLFVLFPNKQAFEVSSHPVERNPL